MSANFRQVRILGYRPLVDRREGTENVHSRIEWLNPTVNVLCFSDRTTWSLISYSEIDLAPRRAAKAGRCQCEKLRREDERANPPSYVSVCFQVVAEV